MPATGRDKWHFVSRSRFLTGRAYLECLQAGTHKASKRDVGRPTVMSLRSSLPRLCIKRIDLGPARRFQVLTTLHHHLFVEPQPFHLQSVADTARGRRDETNSQARGTPASSAIRSRLEPLVILDKLSQCALDRM